MNEFNGYSEKYAVGRAMEVYGGSFFSALGQALQHADAGNELKIRLTWPEEYERYREMALRLPEFRGPDNR